MFIVGTDIKICKQKKINFLWILEHTESKCKKSFKQSERNKPCWFLKIILLKNNTFTVITENMKGFWNAFSLRNAIENLLMNQKQKDLYRKLCTKDA